jgi:uncharacterized membrane protein
MLAILLGVFAALCWSVHDLLARTIAERVGSFNMAALVMGIGALLMSVYILFDHSILNSSREQLMSGLMLGIAYGLGVGGLFKAYSLGPLSLVGPLTAGYPILAILWEVFHGVTPNAFQWACVAATMMGTITVARAGAEDQGNGAVKAGNLPWLLFYSVLAGIGYASSIVIGQDAAVKVGEVEATWLSRASALITILPFMLTEKKVERLNRRTWFCILAIAILDIFAVIAVNASGHFTGKEFAGVGISAYGAFTVLLAQSLLREKISLTKWIGVTLIVSGVGLLSLSQAISAGS